MCSTVWKMALFVEHINHITHCNSLSLRNIQMRACSFLSTSLDPLSWKNFLLSLYLFFFMRLEPSATWQQDLSSISSKAWQIVWEKQLFFIFWQWSCHDTSGYYDKFEPLRFDDFSQTIQGEFSAMENVVVTYLNCLWSDWYFRARSTNDFLNWWKWT